MLRLTPAGSDLLDRASKVAAELEAELFSALPNADKARFQALVERLEAQERDA
jgi:DNA-binding MarR family transcriptional regulator